MARQRRALVIGGSMSGLLAGIMLHRRGWDVDIFERVGSELSGRGAGIVAQAELIARLNALGLDTRDLGVAMTTRQILDRDGRTTATRGWARPLGFLPSWSLSPRRRHGFSRPGQAGLHVGRAWQPL